MPQFSKDKDGEHLESHKGIHDGEIELPRVNSTLPLTSFGVGLDRLEALLNKWYTEPSTYSPEELRACLDSFRQVLFDHLDAEVPFCNPMTSSFQMLIPFR